VEVGKKERVNVALAVSEFVLVETVLLVVMGEIYVPPPPEATVHHRAATAPTAYRGGRESRIGRSSRARRVCRERLEVISGVGIEG
jgi:hypothetical protein